MNVSRLTALLAAAGLASALLAAEPVRLAENGRVLAPVRIAPDASPELRAAASNLAAALTRMTGARFPVIESNAVPAITLGTVTQFPDRAVAEALAGKGPFDAVEAFAIRTGPDGVRLLANTGLGASHAAHRFLELLGCRWFMQGPDWEIVPAVATPVFAGEETSRPDIAARSIWFSRTAQAWEKGDPDANAAFRRWAAGNRLGTSFDFSVGHAWHAIPVAFKDEGYPYKKIFDAHPEYFALVAGKRTPPQFCVSNPGLRDTVAKYAVRYFEKNPAAFMVSLDPADQGGWCECPACEKLGPYPWQPFFLANAVAKELQKAHPGKFAGLLAYSWHSDPPDFMLEPNVYVQLTAGMNASKLSFDDLFAAWTKKCRHIGIYEYMAYWEMDEGLMPAPGFQNRFDVLEARFRRYVSNGVDSVSGQASSTWGANGLGYYLAARLMWDAGADVAALRKDFYEKAFGPAAAPMERYYERLNLDAKPLPGAALLRQCLDDLEEAVRLAQGRPDVLGRLARLRENLVYNAIGLKVNTTNGEEHKKHLLDWFTWSYRTRNNYMNDWITFRSAAGRPAAEELGLTNFFWRNTRDNPWRNDAPVTADELDTRLAAIKTELGDLPAVPPAAWSNRFVLVRTGQAGVESGRSIHSGKGVYLLASTNGEPLRLTVTKRDTGWMEKPDARYSLADQAGVILKEGGLATGRHELSFPVPQKGIYRFACSRGGKGWEVEFPDDLPRALLFERGEKCNPTAFRNVWFYVPKGTRELILYTLPPSGPIIRDPAGKVVRKGTSLGRYEVVPVSPDHAGRLWQQTGRSPNLLFLNAPTVLTLNAAWLFLPADLAAKDALEVALP